MPIYKKYPLIREACVLYATNLFPSLLYRLCHCWGCFSVAALQWFLTLQKKSLKACNYFFFLYISIFDPGLLFSLPNPYHNITICTLLSSSRVQWHLDYRNTQTKMSSPSLAKERPQGRWLVCFAVLTDLSGIYYANLISETVILSTALIPLSNGLILFLHAIIAFRLGTSTGRMLSCSFFLFYCSLSSHIFWWINNHEICNIMKRIVLQSVVSEDILLSYLVSGISLYYILKQLLSFQLSVFNSSCAPWDLHFLIPF